MSDVPLEEPEGDDDLYVRGDDLSLFRPILTGDVFTDVPLSDHDEPQTVMLIAGGMIQRSASQRWSGATNTYSSRETGSLLMISESASESVTVPSRSRPGTLADPDAWGWRRSAQDRDRSARPHRRSRGQRGTTQVSPV